MVLQTFVLKKYRQMLEPVKETLKAFQLGKNCPNDCGCMDPTLFNVVKNEINSMPGSNLSKNEISQVINNLGQCGGKCGNNSGPGAKGGLNGGEIAECYR